MLTLGLQRETASRGSLVLYIQIVFSLFFERVVFGVSPSGLSLTGTCVIIASAIYVAVRISFIVDAENIAWANTLIVYIAEQAIYELLCAN